MKARRLFFSAGILCLCVNTFALDWKTLHERADAISLERARSAQEADPQNAEKLYELGLAYLNAYDHQHAQEIFRKLLARDQASIEAQWGVAECQRREHNYSASEQSLRQIIATRPDFWPAYNSLAYQKFIQKDFNEAARLALIVIRQGVSGVDKSNLVRAYGVYSGAKGLIAYRGGPVSKVINGSAVLPYLKKAQKLQPRSAVVEYGLGSYYMLTLPVLGRSFKKAEKYLLHAIELDVNLADAYVRLAQLYRYRGDIKSSESCLEKALLLDPRNEFALDVQAGGCGYACIGK